MWLWLRGLFTPPPPRPAAPAPPRVRSAEGFAEHETRVLGEFEKTYGITFGNQALLKLALTHRSYLHVTGAGPRDSNERLEFLGDSVLGLVTSEHLYKRNPGEHEGQLTKTKSLLVSKAILSRRALAMGLGRFVLMSHSEIESGGRQRLSILADAFESVIGAVYLDQGFGAARTFIERWLLREARVIVADKRHTNYKSHLQEYVQSTFRTHPVYRIRSAMGPDHSKQFMVEVMVGRKVLGEGRGRNKKEAEQAAARHALEQVGGAPEVLPDRDSVETRPIRRDEPSGRRGPREEAPAGTARRSARAHDDEDDDDEPEVRGRRGRRGEPGETSEAREARPFVPPPPQPRHARPAPPAAPPAPRPQPPRVQPQRPQPPRRPAFFDDDHEEIGRPEGPEDGMEPMRGRPEPLPPPAAVPSYPPARTEPRPERTWERPAEVIEADEEEVDTFEHAAEEIGSAPEPDVHEETRTVEPPPAPAAPSTPESQSFGRRASRRPGRR